MPVRFLSFLCAAGFAAFVLQPVRVSTLSAEPPDPPSAEPSPSRPAADLEAADAQEAQGSGGKEPSWDVTKPRGTTREIDFVTREGTWMSVDISADGKWIVFDLLGHIYRVAAAGGDAECLTQSSGVAVNNHPRLPADGKPIAFVSDRSGQNNLWLMDADGANPKAVLSNKDVRVSEPAWTPDGRFILVRRQSVAPNAGGGGGGGGLWMYSRDGGEGVELIGREP